VLLAQSKEANLPIPLTYLRQKPPEIYKLAAGDVLGVYIEGILGDLDQVPPVNVVEITGQAPSLGFPVPVAEDGKLSLPQIDPISVAGMSISQAKQAIIKAYTTGAEPILQRGRERIIVSLIRPRHVRVLVLRQDAPASTPALAEPGIIHSSREFRGGAERLIRTRGTGTGSIVDLPAYQNDVLNALTRTGGLPGLDAANEIVIQRGHLQNDGLVSQAYVDGDRVVIPDSVAVPKGEITRIPLRMRPNEPLPFQPEDIELHTGDVVLIEARAPELYYTGGLLPSGEYPLPRDYDLTVIEAITQTGGPLVNGGINANNLSGALVEPGIGSPSPRLLTVVRRTRTGGQVPIIVDLNLALTNPEENIFVQSGDVLILQETRHQALARYFTDVFNVVNVFEFFSRGSASGIGTLSVP
jgi:protein involved in polysaccharide export with SLBB domain